MPYSSSLGLSENQRFLRHCHSQPANTVQKTSKANSIKIGKKIYVVKTNQVWTSRSDGRSLNQVKKRQNTSEIENQAFLPHQNKTKKSYTAKKVETEKDRTEIRILKQSTSNSPLPPLAKSDLPKYTRSGVDFSTILKQSVYSTENTKPFLTASSEITDLVKNKLEHTVSIREVINHTRSPRSSRNISSWRESNLLKLGSEDFDYFEEELKQNGLDFQNMITEYLKRGDNSLAAVSPIMEAYWESICPALRHLKDARCFQAKAYHPHLRYHGTVDCIAMYKGKPTLIEIKKTSSPKTNLLMTIDGSIQNVATLGALNADPMWPFQINNLILIYANADGTPASVLEFNQTDIQLFWKLWLRRVYQFWKNVDNNVNDNKFVEAQIDTACFQSDINLKIDSSRVSEERENSSEAVELKPQEAHIFTTTSKDSVPNSQASREGNQLNSILQTSVKIVESPPQESYHSQNKARNQENVGSSSPDVNNYSEPLSEQKISYHAENMPHVQLSQEQQNETPPKIEEQKGFFKTLWSMWK